ncbi:MAG: hypothetical protein PHT38_00260 [Halothiobacillus sp.]|jgi:hypothetical protein|nr:hypothetical protein [Halothiobacillus sp.]MDY0146534.1 hypothetical protein [Halothiobacillus sp.]
MSTQNPAIGGYAAFMSAQSSQGRIVFSKEDESTLCLAWDGLTIMKEERSGVRKSKGEVVAQASKEDCFSKMSVAIIDALNQGWIFTNGKVVTTKLVGVSVMDHIDGDIDKDGVGFFLSWEKAQEEITVPNQLIRTDIGAAVHLKHQLFKMAGFPKPLSGTVKLGSDNFFALWRLKKHYPNAVKMMSLSTHSDIDLNPTDWRTSHSEIMEEFGLIMPGMKIDKSKAKLVPVNFF